MSWIPNVVGFQLVWMASVGGAARGWWWLGPVAVVLFAVYQLSVSHSRRSDWQMMLLCAVVGFGVDSLWVVLDLMRFDTPWPSPAVAPIWIVSMWVGFALTLNHSLSSLKQLPWIAGLLGLLGGPLAYWAAERAWQAVELRPSALPYIALGVSWALLTPALLTLAERLRAPTSSASAA